MDPISAIASQIPPPTTGPQSPEGALKDEFLTLLVAQLSNQDPLNPQDPSEFTAQLAQFTTLEQMISIGQILQEQSAIQTSTLATSAASFIGKVAEIADNHIQISNGVASEAILNMPAASSSTVVKILDSSGRVVRTVDLGASSTGPRGFTWDGIMTDGTAAPSGTYTIEVEAADAQGTSIPVDISTTGVVQGVRFVGGIVLLTINGTDHTLGELLGLREPTAPPTAPTAPIPNFTDDGDASEEGGSAAAKLLSKLGGVASAIF